MEHTTPYSNDKSIAVLPFMNISSDPENEFFSDGITEEIINALTAIQNLKVIARTSSFSYKNKNVDVRIIGKELGVTTILEGSVRKIRDRVRITAQLINSKDGTHLWSKTFDRQLEDIFDLQDEISLLIADNIRENYGHLEINDSLISHPDIDVALYQKFLKGKFLINKFNVKDIKDGISILKEVVEQEPNFALAQVNIHYGYNSLAAGGLMPVDEALATGKKYLDKALELDLMLPEAYHSLGWHSLNQDWDFKNATKYLLEAIELRPGYAEAHQKLFINLVLEGNLEEGYKHIKIAHDFDPIATLNNYFLGYYYYVTEDFDKTNYFLEKTFELEPTFIVGYSIYSLSLIMQNRPDYVLELAKRVPAVEGAEIEKQLMNTLAHCKMGQNTETEKGLNSLKLALNIESGERVRFFLIYIETLLGNFENALEHIEMGVSRREPLMTLLKVDPLLKPLHKFDRFQQALKEVFAKSDLALKEPANPPISILNGSEIEDYLGKLNQLMAEENVFLNPSLSLRSLAKELGTHPNKLSWLINEKIGKNFNEYVNEYRLDTFKEKALNPKNTHLTLLGLAYESGFNSKSVFNSFFKKQEGVSPKTWVKNTRG